MATQELTPVETQGSGAAPFSLPVYSRHERAWKRAWFKKRAFARLWLLSLLSMFPLAVLMSYLKEEFGCLTYLLWLLTVMAMTKLTNRTALPEIDPLEDERAPFLFLRSFSAKGLKKRPDRTLRAGVHRLRITHNLAELLEWRQCLGAVLVLQEEERTTSTPSWSRAQREEDEPRLVVLAEDDAHWLETIKQLVSRCRALILLPGATSGLIEEARLLISSNLMDRVLVLMPPLSRVWFPDEKEERRLRLSWQETQAALEKKQGWRLPDYEPEGMLYLPNQDFSVKEWRPLGAKMLGLNSALRELSTVPDRDCTPLSALLSELLTKGFRQVSGNIFERKNG